MSILKYLKRSAPTSSGNEVPAVAKSSRNISDLANDTRDAGNDVQDCQDWSISIFLPKTTIISAFIFIETNIILISRVCNESVVKQSKGFIDSWKIDREWSCYIQNKGMHCRLCQKFDERPFGRDAWNREPSVRFRASKRQRARTNSSSQRCY